MPEFAVAFGGGADVGFEFRAWSGRLLMTHSGQWAGHFAAMHNAALA